MTEREISVQTPDGDMATFVVHPEGDGPYPVAVLYLDAPGYREQVKENARRFAADGYYVVAPNLFYRVAEDGDESEGDARERMMARIRSLKPEMVASDTRAVLDAVADDPAAADGPKVCVGYCMGARFALYVASTMADEFVAAAGIHPGALVTDAPDSPHTWLPGVRAEIYYAFAEHDRTATPENVEQFRNAVEENGVAGTVERLSGASHGFAMADLEAYDRDASERHFEQTLELWRRSLSAEPVRG